MMNKIANWPAPKNITALCTTRLLGFSLPPYDHNNFGLHVGDNEAHVRQNRQQLKDELNLSNEPVWLNQTHSTVCVLPERTNNREADAAISHSIDHPLAILTADCLPITLCDTNGTEIAAIHAGWKGLLNGIIENTLSQMRSQPTDLMAWIGPAICQRCFEVGEEVYNLFTKKYPFTQTAFQSKGTKWLANLPKMAEMVLKNQGINAIYQSDLCTFELKNEFYSYRRSSKTGRIATLIWFNHPTRG